MGKWSKFKQRFPMRKNALADLMTEFLPMEDDLLLMKFARQEQRVDEFEDKTKLEKLKLEAISQVLAGRFEARDLSQMKHVDLGTFTLMDSVHVSTANRDAVFAWLRESGNEDLIKEEVNSKRLGSLVKDVLSGSEEFDPDAAGLSIFMQQKIKLTTTAK